MTHGETSKLVSRNVPKVEIFGTSKLSSLRCPESQLLDISGHVRKSVESTDFLRFPEICRNPQKSTKSQKSTFLPKSWKVALFGTLGTTLRIWPETRKSARIEVLAGLARNPKIGPDTKKCQFLRSQKSAKKCENFRNFWPPKNPKKWSRARGNDASQTGAHSARRAQKNSTFSRIFRGKGKKCPFFRLNGRFCD